MSQFCDTRLDNCIRTLVKWGKNPDNCLIVVRGDQRGYKVIRKNWFSIIVEKIFYKSCVNKSEVGAHISGCLEQESDLLSRCSKRHLTQLRGALKKLNDKFQSAACQLLEAPYERVGVALKNEHPPCQMESLDQLTTYTQLNEREVFKHQIELIGRMYRLAPAIQENIMLNQDRMSLDLKKRLKSGDATPAEKDELLQWSRDLLYKYMRQRYYIPFLKEACNRTEQCYPKYYEDGELRPKMVSQIHNMCEEAWNKVFFYALFNSGESIQKMEENCPLALKYQFELMMGRHNEWSLNTITMLNPNRCVGWKDHLDVPLRCLGPTPSSNKQCCSLSMLMNEVLLDEIHTRAVIRELQNIIVEKQDASKQDICYFDARKVKLSPDNKVKEHFRKTPYYKRFVIQVNNKKITVLKG